MSDHTEAEVYALDMVMNVSAHAIHLALNPESADPDHVDRGTVYASKVH